MAKIAAPGYPKGKWTTFEPLLSTTGVIVERYGSNGRDKTTGEQLHAWRPVPSKTRHVCNVTSPEQSDIVFSGRTDPAPAPAPKAEAPVPPSPYGPGPVDAPVHPAPAPAPRPTPPPVCSHGWTLGLCTAPTCKHAPAPQSPAPTIEAPAPTAPAPLDLEAIANALSPRMRGEIVDLLKSYGIEPPTSKLEVVMPNGETHKADGIVHPALVEVIPYVARGENVYLYGPAGSGKTFGGVQAAALCGLRSVVITCPGMSVAKLMGGVRADGEVTVTPFIEVWRDGGVAIFDEFDRMDPGVAAMLNSALENGTYTHGTTVIKRHAQCAIVANGNTTLRGATREYTAAKPLDYSTAARFPFIEWGYDNAHQDAMALAILKNKTVATQLTKWTRSIMATIKRDRVELVWAGPRESTRIATELTRGVPIERAAERWIWRGLDPAIVERITREIPYPAIQIEAK